MINSARSNKLYCMALGSLLLIACSGKKDGEGPASENSKSDGYSNVHITLAIKNANTTALAAAAPKNCHVQDAPSGPAADGLCVSADNAEVWASGMYIFKINSGDSFSGARLLGGGAGLGQNGYLEGAKFDLAELGTLQGEDTLWSVYDKKPEFSAVHLELSYLKVFFTIKGEKWEMLIPYQNQSLENDDWVKGCFNEAYRAEMVERANPLPGLAFQKGDYLFCKPSGDTHCEVKDFQWFDKTTSQLTSTRPTSPRRFEYLVQNSSTTCSVSSANGIPDLKTSSVPLFGMINQPLFKLYADFSHGKDSKTNTGAGKPADVTQEEWDAHGKAGKPQSPHFIYFLEQNGETKKGNRINVKLTFDLDNYLVLNGITNLNTASTEDILKVITTKDIFLRDGTAKGNEFTPQLPVSIKVDLLTVPLSELYQVPDPGTKAAAAE